MRYKTWFGLLTLIASAFFYIGNSWASGISIEDPKHPPFDPRTIEWKTGQIIGISQVNNPEGGITLFFELATGSYFSHVGIVKKNSDGSVVVYESHLVGATKVSLKEFLKRSYVESSKKYRAAVVELIEPLTDEQSATLIAKAEKRIEDAIPYNLEQNYNSESKNCGEHVHDLFRSIGIEGIGRINRYSELNLDAMEGQMLKYYSRYFYLGEHTPEEYLERVPSYRTVVPVTVMTSPKVRVVGSNVPFEIVSEKDILNTWIQEGGIQYVAGFGKMLEAQRNGQGPETLDPVEIGAFAQELVGAFLPRANDRPFSTVRKLQGLPEEDEADR